jgi:hypothetical protein
MVTTHKQHVFLAVRPSGRVDQRIHPQDAVVLFVRIIEEWGPFPSGGPDSALGLDYNTTTLRFNTVFSPLFAHWICIDDGSKRRCQSSRYGLDYNTRPFFAALLFYRPKVRAPQPHACLALSTELLVGWPG